MAGTANALLMRILSAAVMAPAAIAAAYVGGWLFAFFWALAAAIVLYEWSTIVLAARVLNSTSRAMWIVTGVVYAALMLIMPLVLRSDAAFGLAALLFLFAVVWTTDILGYFGGRAFGGPKLAPAISPAKTWSGAVCGTMGAAIASAVVAQAIGVPHWSGLIATGMLLSVVAQVGDLAESAFKRKFQTKDASHLIPGHGGVMDRLDGFWAAAVCGALFGLCRGGFAAPAAGLLLW